MIVAKISLILKKSLAGLTLVAICAAAPAIAQDGTETPTYGDEYVLGPADTVTIRMVAWDSATLSFVRFDEIEGNYTIAPNGQMLLPLIGPVEAAGQTPSVLSEMLSIFLQQSIGLAEEPSASVEVFEYRPVYILGDVQRPGAYEYQPGLRVDQAIALAGGLRRADDLSDGAVRTAVRDQGTLREAQIQRVQFAVRAARLEAETTGATELVIPTGLRHPDGPAALDEAVARETALFSSRRDSLVRALGALDETEALLKREEAALEAKLGGLNTQLELLNTQLEATEQLVERGLARQPQLVAIQSSLIEMQSRQTDVETALFRAQQSQTEVARDRIDLETRRQETSLAELQTVKSQMAQFDTRINMLEALRAEGEVALLDLSEGIETVLIFNISREEGSLENVERSFKLDPLDVLEISAVTEDDANAAGSGQ
ncbi:MAG: polysaccharide biosynthesis/export family protein [Pseudomonadota bacterium]